MTDDEIREAYTDFCLEYSIDADEYALCMKIVYDIESPMQYAVILGVAMFAEYRAAHNKLHIERLRERVPRTERST